LSESSQITFNLASDIAGQYVDVHSPEPITAPECAVASVFQNSSGKGSMFNVLCWFSRVR